MSKVYKSKASDKLVVNIPYDVIGALDIKDGDDVDFFKFSGKSFLFAKKNDIVDLLTKLQSQGSAPIKQVGPVIPAKQAGAGAPAKQAAAGAGSVQVDAKELVILQKLDTLRYNDRTKDKVNAMLTPEERQTLQGMVKKDFVGLFKKSNEQEFKYSISKGIYDMFLYGKRPKAVAAAAAPNAPIVAATPAISYKMAEPVKQKAWEQKLGGGSAYTSMLDSKGFVVVQSEAEASSLSAALEESIRQGQVLGTRAFNKKFYIATRSFINQNLTRIMRQLDNKDKGVSVEEISKETGIDEDGIRAILYIMSESGDVTEMRRDVFKLA